MCVCVPVLVLCSCLCTGMCVCLCVCMCVLPHCSLHYLKFEGTESDTRKDVKDILFWWVVNLS